MANTAQTSINEPGAGSDEPFIQFRGVRKAFGEKVVYSGLNLQVARGSALTIVGGSGVGKSVMLKMLIGLLRPDAGSVRFEKCAAAFWKRGKNL